MGTADAGISLLVSDRDGAEQQVAVSSDILREGLHTDVHAMREGVEQHAGGVGVVERYGDASRPCRGDDGRQVLHLHGDGARALAPDQRRIGPDPRGDAVSDQRMVAFDLDTEAGEQVIAQFAGGPVHAVGNEHVRAGAADTPGTRAPAPPALPAPRSSDARPRAPRCAPRAPAWSACRRGHRCSAPPAASRRPLRSAD